MQSRTKMILGGIAIFAVAFTIGNVTRPDVSQAAKAVAARLRPSRGPKFPEGDTLVMADTIKARCGKGAEAGRRNCYMGQLLALRAQRGTRFAMGTLGRLATIDRAVDQEGHDYSHMIGITAYKESKDVTGSFKSCTEILQSGCYHGVIQTYLISQKSVGATEINTVCKEWTSPDADRWLRFQCVHGMGHGLTMFYDHDLPRALLGCDMLNEEWDQKSCYGGAFMENVVYATDPRMAHMVMDDAAGGDHGADSHGGGMAGMDMGGAAPAPTAGKYKMIDKADLFFPCDAMAARYQEDCWAMQPAVMLQLTDGSFEKTFRGCDGAPKEWRTVCYAGTGTEVSGYALRDQQAAIGMCLKGQPKYQPWCFRGVVKNFIDVTAKADDGMKFCKIVPGRPNQMECYRAVGEEIAVLRNTLEGRRPMCEVITGDAGGRDACLFGAQVLTDRPKGVPVAE